MRKISNAEKFEKRRRKHIRQRVAALSAVTVAIALVGGSVMQHLSPIDAVAKESFRGIQTIVEEHSGDDKPAYKILEIVPGVGRFNDGFGDITMSLGTLGYMVGGQAAVEKDMQNIFARTPAAYYKYENRQALATKLVPAGFEDTNNYNTNLTPIIIKYEEGYPGISAGIAGDNSANSQWLVASNKRDDFDINASYDDTKFPTGYVNGYFDAADNGAYVMVGSTDRARGGSIFKYQPSGTYQVTFTNVGRGLEGYVVSGAYEDWRSFSDSTIVYTLIDGIYYPAGTVGSHRDESPSDYTPDENKYDNELELEDKNEKNIIDEELPDENKDLENKDNHDENNNNDNNNNNENNNNDSDNNQNQENNDSNNEIEVPNDNGNQENADFIVNRSIPQIVDGNYVIPNSYTEGDPLVEGEYNLEENEGGNDYGKYSVLTFDYVYDSQTEMTIYDVADFTTVNYDGGEPVPFDTYVTGNEVRRNNNVPNTGIEQGGALDENNELTDGEGTAISSETNEFEQAYGASATFVYVGTGEVDGQYAGKQRYNITPDASAGLIELRNTPVWFKCCSGNNWMLRYVFQTLAGEDNHAEGFKIEVETKQAGAVTIEDVNAADFIAVEDGSGYLLGTAVDRHYMSYAGNQDINNGAYDLTIDVLARIVYRAAFDLVPVMVDYGIVELKDLNNDNGKSPEYEDPNDSKTPGGNEQDDYAIEDIDLPVLEDNSEYIVEDNKNIEITGDIDSSEAQNVQEDAKENQGGIRGFFEVAKNKLTKNGANIGVLKQITAITKETEAEANNNANQLKPILKKELPVDTVQRVEAVEKAQEEKSVEVVETVQNEEVVKSVQKEAVETEKEIVADNKALESEIVLTKEIELEDINDNKAPNESDDEKEDKNDNRDQNQNESESEAVVSEEGADYILRTSNGSSRYLYCIRFNTYTRNLFKILAGC